MLRVVPISARGGGPGRRVWEGRCCGDQAMAHANGSVGALERPEVATCATIATHPHAATTMLAGLREVVCACESQSLPTTRQAIQQRVQRSTHAAVARSSLVLCVLESDGGFDLIWRQDAEWSQAQAGRRVVVH